MAIEQRNGKHLYVTSVLIRIAATMFRMTQKAFDDKTANNYLCDTFS